MKKKVRIFKMALGGDPKKDNKSKPQKTAEDFRKRDFRYDADAQAMYMAMLDQGQYLTPDEDLGDTFSKVGKTKFNSRVLDSEGNPVRAWSPDGMLKYSEMDKFKNYNVTPERVTARGINTATIKPDILAQKYHEDVAPGLRYTFTPEGVPHMYASTPEGQELLDYANNELGNYVLGFKGGRAGVMYDVPSDIYAKHILQKAGPRGGLVPIPPREMPNTMQPLPMPENYQGIPPMQDRHLVEYPDKYQTGGNWIQDVRKSMEQRGSVGRCSGTNFGGPDCPKGSPQYNLAVTFRQMAQKNKKKVYGGNIADQNVNIDYLTNTVKNNFLGHLTTNAENVRAEDQYINQVEEQMLQDAQNYMQYGGNNNTDFGYVGNPMFEQHANKDLMMQNQNANLFNQFATGLEQLGNDQFWQKDLQAKTTFNKNEAGRQAKKEYAAINKDYNQHMKQMNKSPLYRYQYEQDLINLGNPQMIYGGDLPKAQQGIDEITSYKNKVNYYTDIYGETRNNWPKKVAEEVKQSEIVLSDKINSIKTEKSKELQQQKNEAESSGDYALARRLDSELKKINSWKSFEDKATTTSSGSGMVGGFKGAMRQIEPEELIAAYESQVLPSINSQKNTQTNSQNSDFRFYEEPGVNNNTTQEPTTAQYAQQVQKQKTTGTGTGTKSTQTYNNIDKEKSDKPETEQRGNTKPDFGNENNDGNVRTNQNQDYRGGIPTNVGMLYPQYRPSMFGPRYTAPLLYNPGDITKTEAEFRKPLFRPGKQGAMKSITFHHGVPGSGSYNNQNAIPQSGNNVYQSINQIPMNTIRKVLDTANMSDEELAELEMQNEKQRQYENDKAQNQMFYEEMDRFDRSQMRYGGMKKYQGNEQSEVTIENNERVSGFPEDPSTLTPEQRAAYYDLAKSMQANNYGIVPGAIRTAGNFVEKVGDVFVPKHKRKIRSGSFMYGGVPQYFTGGDNPGVGTLVESNQQGWSPQNWKEGDAPLVRPQLDQYGNYQLVPTDPNNPAAIQAAEYLNSNEGGIKQTYFQGTGDTDFKKGYARNIKTGTQFVQDPKDWGGYIDKGTDLDQYRTHIVQPGHAISTHLGEQMGYSSVNQKEIPKSFKPAGAYKYDPKTGGYNIEVMGVKDVNNPLREGTGGYYQTAFKQRYGGVAMQGAAHPSEYRGYNPDTSMLLAMMYGGPFMSEFAYGGVPEYLNGGMPTGTADLGQDTWGQTKITEGLDPNKKAQIAKMAFDAGTAGLTMLGNAITEPRSNYMEMTSADQVYRSDELMNRGTDGTLGNFQGLRSDQSLVGMGAKNTGRTAGISRFGGVPEYVEGGEYELTEEEIAQIMRMGGNIEFL